MSLPFGGNIEFEYMNCIGVTSTHEELIVDWKTKSLNIGVTENQKRFQLRIGFL